MVARGELWWCETPDAGRRPVLVLTRDVAIGALNAVTVAPLTTRIRNIRTEVQLDAADGAPRPSVVSLDNVTRVTKTALSKRIVGLSPERMREVCHALHFALDC